MQGLRIDHLVEHRDGENIYFSLTCTICGKDTPKKEEKRCTNS